MNGCELENGNQLQMHMTPLSHKNILYKQKPNINHFSSLGPLSELTSNSSLPKPKPCREV